MVALVAVLIGTAVGFAAMPGANKAMVITRLDANDTSQQISGNLNLNSGGIDTSVALVVPRGTTTVGSLTPPSGTRLFAKNGIAADQYCDRSGNCLSAADAYGGTGESLPPGTIAMFTNSCPAGWQEFSALAGKIPKGISVGDTETQVRTLSGYYCPVNYVEQRGRTCIPPGTEQARLYPNRVCAVTTQCDNFANACRGDFHVGSDARCQQYKVLNGTCTPVVGSRAGVGLTSCNISGTKDEAYLVAAERFSRAVQHTHPGPSREVDLEKQGSNYLYSIVANETISAGYAYPPTFGVVFCKK